MKKQSSPAKIKNLVPNNPEYDRLTMDPEEIAAERRAIKNTLYDSSYKTAAGQWKRRDEPGEQERSKYRKIDPDAVRKEKHLELNRQPRIKEKDIYSTRKSKWSFEEFMEMTTRHRKESFLH